MLVRWPSFCTVPVAEMSSRTGFFFQWRRSYLSGTVRPLFAFGSGGRGHWSFLIRATPRTFLR